jgi:HEAT repeat protein
MNALSVAQPVTAKSLDALTASLDGADHRTAALALGSHRHRAGDALLIPAAAASQALLGRYASSTGAARVLYAKALGNSGDPAAVAPLRDAIAGGDPVLRDAAVYALRHVPGPEVDGLLAGALDDPDLAFAAVRAIGSRDPAVWRDRLEAIRARYADRNDVQTAIHGIFRRWG